MPPDAKDLLKRSKQGDEAAFAAVYQAFNSSVRDYIRSASPDGADIDDLVQQTWVEAWNNSRRFNLNRSFSDWIRAVSRRVIANAISSEVPLSASSGKSVIRSAANSSLRAYKDRERNDLIKGTTDELLSYIPEDDRILLTLRNVEELTYPELGRLYNVKADVIKTRLARLRKRILRVYGGVPESALEDRSLVTPDPLIVQVTLDFQRLLNEVVADSDTLFHLTPEQFEELIADIWARFGYEIELTKRTRDGGRDVVAIRRAHVELKFLIECKRYAKLRKVGVSFVRALYGIKTHEGATKAIIATTSSFTRDATTFVGSHRWELEARDHDGIVGWVKEARGMVRRPGSSLWVPKWVAGYPDH